MIFPGTNVEQVGYYKENGIAQADAITHGHVRTPYQNVTSDLSGVPKFIARAEGRGKCRRSDGEKRRPYLHLKNSRTRSDEHGNLSSLTTFVTRSAICLWDVSVG